MTTRNDADRVDTAEEPRFPAVPNAYVPSGRTSLIAVASMVAVGAISALLGGVVMFLGDQVLSAIGSFASSLGQLPGVIVFVLSLAAYAIVAFFVGTWIGGAVARSGFWGKNRNASLAAAIGFLAGAGAILVMYGARVQELGPEAFDSGIDWLKIGIYAAGVLFGSAVLARERVLDRPFCEGCGVYMIASEALSIPITREAALVQVLREGRISDLMEFGTEPDTGRSRCVVKLSHCPVCRAHGVLSCTEELVTVTVDDNGKESSRHQSRQVFSETVGGDAVQVLLGLGESGKLERDRSDLAVSSRSATPHQEETTSEALACATCNARSAEVTTLVPMACPAGMGHSGATDLLRDHGFIRERSVLVPRCSACAKAERRRAIGGQVAAYTGLVAGALAMLAVGGASESGLVAVVAGIAVFGAVVLIVMRLATRGAPSDVNVRSPVEHPAVQAALLAGWKRSGGILPKGGPSPDVLTPLDFSRLDRPRQEAR